MLRKYLHGSFGLLLAFVLLSVVQYSIGQAALAQSDGQVYIVQSGDSLYKISENAYGNGNLWHTIVDATNAKAKEDSSFDEINDPRQLRVGQKIWVPNQSTGSTSETAAPEASVRFVEPVNGATIAPTFTVQMMATGMKVEPAGDIHPGAGHMHILVDTDFVAPGEVILKDEQHLHYGKGQLTTTLHLDPGVHVLRLQFANGAHVALEGPQYRDVITVNVSTEQTSIRFVSPINGATVPPTFTVQMAASGLKIEPAGDIHPGAGHMHILVDTDFVAPGEVILKDDQHLHYGKGQLTTTLHLDPGPHVLRLQYANGAHIALEGPQYRDVITVAVADNSPAMRFVSPVDGSTVPPTFTVQLTATGVTVERAGDIHPGGGHLHVLVDTDFTEPGELILRDPQHIHFWKGEYTGTLHLEPGVHVLRLQFSNGAHIALDGPQYRNVITVSVADNAPAMHFVEPVNGATVPPTFTVQLTATGVTVERAGDIHPGGGHLHVLVDTDFTEPGELILRDPQHIHFWKGEYTGTLHLTPGEHVLRLQFSNGAHIALDGPQYRDIITVTVGENAEQTGVHFVDPINGATVPPTFTVQMAATGLTVEPAGDIHPGAGHMHILVDTDFVSPGDVILKDEQHLHYGQGQLSTTLHLTPGEHVLRLQFANGAHIALDGPQYQDTVTVTVK